MKLRTETFCLISCLVSFWEPCFVVITLHIHLVLFQGELPCKKDEDICRLA